MNWSAFFIYGAGVFLVLLALFILKVSRRRIDIDETPEAMYERATRWQQKIVQLDDMVERVQEDEKWCRYVENIKGRKNGLRKV